jgi:hypothetical protein
MKEIVGYRLEARDGLIGKCHDFLFDDRGWTIRYMVADTGGWLPGRRVLISPLALEEPDWRERRLPVDLTKQQIEQAPSLATDEPVSRQFELDYYAYYGWPYYWAGGGVWGPYAFPQKLREAGGAETSEEQSGDRHLRSYREVSGYHIAARDRDIGHVDDLIVEDRSWILRYIVVDTRNWLPGRHVLVAPNWFTEILWAERSIRTDLTAEQIENSPEYNPGAPINREYEQQLYDFYGRPVYWT